MKFVVPLTCVFAGILLAGCAHHGATHATVMAGHTSAIVTPNESLAGKVVACNSAGRFVVLNFPGAQMPKLDQTLFLYRAGLKVAEIKVTGPQDNDNTVADIITGDAQTGDDVRDQ